jgi:hypothetical protein
MKPKVFGEIKSRWAGRVCLRSSRELIYTWLPLLRAILLELISLLTGVTPCLELTQNQVLV